MITENQICAFVGTKRTTEIIIYIKIINLGISVCHMMKEEINGYQEYVLTERVLFWVIIQKKMMLSNQLRGEIKYFGEFAPQKELFKNYLKEYKTGES